MTRSTRAFISVIRKDLQSWRRSPIGVIVTVIPTFLLFILVGISAPAVGTHPVAVVSLDNGPLAQEFVSTLHNIGAFVVIDTDNTTAQSLFQNLKVAGVITIPADFDSNLTSKRSVIINYEVDNTNLDMAGDLRRSLPSAITAFYSQVNTNVSISPIKTQILETDLRPEDVSLIQYMIVPALVVTLITGGLINGSLIMVNEWENTTMKKLVLAPVSRGAIIASKTVAGWLITSSIGAVFLVGGVALGLLKPAGPISWLGLILSVLLLALFSSSLGIAAGTILRESSKVGGVVMSGAFFLFLLSGGFSPLSFLPKIVQTVAAFIPNTYGVNALLISAFYNTSQGLAQDFLVLGFAAAVTIAIATIALKRTTG